VSKLRILCIAMLSIGLALSAAPPADAQADKEVLQKYFQAIGTDLAKRRDSAMSVLIEMNDQESKAFWPLKQAYDAELKKIFEARFAVLDEFDGVHEKLTSEQATDLAERALAIDVSRTELHRKYFDLMSEKVSPVVAVQFLQLQSQFETMADMEIASRVPLAMR
jgi:hypothetical protein